MWRGTILLMLATGALVAPAGVAQARTANVSIGEFFYRADRVRIEPGDSVLWANRGDVLHTVTSRRGAPERFDSDFVDAGQTFTRAFTRPGTYRYLCTLHPGQMSGVVQVGPDRVKPVVGGLTARGGKRKVRVAFRLSEKAKVVVKVTRSGRTVRTIDVRKPIDGFITQLMERPGPGSYRVTVRATDLEGNKAKPVTTSFTVR